ncbi:VCBS repeat-containing protein [Maribacter sp. 1_MG-2023]|uniref:VCBS repeat-containing protein n=1 Tax=Maribacter sp. 1_MG-2023 TaxID=3062677 RepID=UPI0026E26BD1|nr:VCBS repeat-containing protein [Maribacter sp. 1_MG-2023]MDO6470460.1 VCBS repeat-containing protein [Maribacter sp. 1_MG-2023]
MSKKEAIYKVLLIFLVLISSCTKKKKLPVSDTDKRFTLIDYTYSGIDFENSLVETQEDNHLLNEKFVNGAGVAIADINNDGFPDIFFTGNQVHDQIFLNKGNLQFQDITESSGIHNVKTWSTGITFADVNADGYQDIYICKSAKGDFEESPNLLYLNNGDLTFTEAAKQYNVADLGFAVQANFFDFDKDGYLDMYLVNQPPSYGNRKGGETPLKNANPLYSDKLYRNLGNEKGFVEISAFSGIQNLAHGLSAAIGDINNDLWTDIYVTNDYDKPDFMYLNTANGKFKDVLKQSFKHTSNFSMGSDIADYDNDGNLDIMVVDMVAEDHKRIKTNMGGMNPEDFWAIVKNGGHYQYMFNTLQRNNGNGTFSDLAQLGGVSNTDWSWGPLIADFDNDGLKDIFVTNGIKRNMRYSDVNTTYEIILDSLEQVAHETNEKFQDIVDILALAKMAPEDKLTNYMYKNNGDLTFINAIQDWGFDLPSLSNGAAYADLDLDGDLDIVVNNINEKAFLYRNNTIERSQGNYLRVALNANKNKSIYGTRVTLFKDAELWQMIEITNTRGYMSKSEDIAHFGLGEVESIEKIEIKWPDGTVEELRDVNANQLLDLTKGTSGKGSSILTLKKNRKLFTNSTKAAKLSYKHQENTYDDFKREVLLPHKMSTFGPSIAVGDVNADGLDDFYVGGAAGFSGALFLQESSGFKEITDGEWSMDKASEDMGSTFFDVDNDGDQDLLVVSGGNEFIPGSKNLHDRLYINDGAGNFKKTKNRIPKDSSSGSVVEKADFDNDGDLDIFIGGRLVPGNYPQPANSRLLENRNGFLVDVTDKVAPDFKSLGMVTSATWVDINNDNKLDIVVVGEWMPVTTFIQKEDGAFSIKNIKGLEDSEGWYYKVVHKDMDGDGDEDLIVGNLGLNYKYKATKATPFEVYSYDFDKNGSTDIVLSYYEHGKLFPIRGRSCSIQQMPSLEKKFPTFKSFGEADLTTIYGADLERSLHLKANTFASYYLENIEGKSFKKHLLPQLAQVSSINNIIADDFDNDGKQDILISGNLYASEIETPRNDAGVGLFLKGNGKGNFNAITVLESGFFAPHDAKDMKRIKHGKTEAVLVANNNNFIQLISILP